MWGLWKRGVWQFIEMFLLQRSGREVRSYKGRNVHHLNVVTYNWTEGSIISHVRIYEQWAACLSGQGASYSALLPGMINVRCCDVQWDMRLGDGHCLGPPAMRSSGWWPMPIDIWYHSFHSQHSHMINVSNPQLSPGPLMTTQDYRTQNTENWRINRTRGWLMFSLCELDSRI